MDGLPIFVALLQNVGEGRGRFLKRCLLFRKKAQILCDGLQFGASICAALHRLCSLSLIPRKAQPLTHFSV
jgi:hypothetical protein